MDSKEDGEGHEDRPTSPYGVLHHLSEEAVEVAGEAVHSVHLGNPNSQSGPGHRRSQSEVTPVVHRRTSSFQRLKSQVQKAWRWGANSRERDYNPNFNPEVLGNQKRQWYQLHSKTLEHVQYKDPTSLFEHFIIVGLHPDANLEVVENAFAKRKKWELDMKKSGLIEMLDYRGPSFPTLEPQTLFKYPPGKRLAMRLKDLSAFCFPGGVKARLLERTPSLSDLNELVYGQAVDNATLYGVCLHVTEMVQKPPGILATSSPLSQSSGRCCRYLVSAPRCYCVLTRVPFFELHYEMLNSIIAQERLNRITQFVTEMSLTSYVPSAAKLHCQMNGYVESPRTDCSADLMASAIPVDSAVALAAAATGIISDDEIQSSSLKMSDPPSPESVTASESSDLRQAREVDKDGRRNSQYFDECASEVSETRFDALERMYSSGEVGQVSPVIGSFWCFRSRTMEGVGSSECLFSPVRSMASEDEDDILFLNSEKDFGDELIMEWARENKNDLLQIVCSYHALPIPARGSEIVFRPLEHLQAVEYRRPSVEAFGIPGKYLDSIEAAEVNAKLAAAEEALALSIWTTATMCRVLSLEMFLSGFALLAGVLLEKQVVVVCPNLGFLSATVLSVVSMIRPFQWQSILLPILPGRMLDFLDAPVPFIVGININLLI
ncbi:hypothetical protein HS088_TW10G00815 [Tripterygium wilfordii]|uniref:UDENN domain-containing protein n=1 Tax=Tripterygium wilfordii TaxID=458696 RepID=A0A7J7D6B6_TRIWF|nr:hypothetical protein HS088_TW10G00815 [Tripterygium wilfordii]